MPKRPKKKAVINMRARRADLDLIDQAARALRQTRSEFIRNAAETRARRVMETVTRKPPEREQPTGYHYDSQGYCDNPGRGY